MSRKKKNKATSQPKERRKHNSALRDPTTREMFEDLKGTWNTLSLVARGDHLQTLVDQGCTRRGLAHDLGCDEGSVRRDLEISKLPDGQRKLVELGASPRSFLFRARRERLTQAYQEKIASSSAQQQEIDSLVRLLHDTMTDAGISCSSHRWQLLDEVWYRLYDYAVRSRQFPGRFPLPCPASPDTDPQKVISDSRPKMEPAHKADTFWFEICCEQITQALFKLAPDDSTRQLAIRQAQRAYDSVNPFTIETTGPNKGKKMARR
jgi:hypothetical protein